MTLPYIRDTYRVPAWRGGRVRFEGRVGRILSAHGAHLHVVFEDGRKGYLHPTWGVEYLGRDDNPMRVSTQQDLPLDARAKDPPPEYLLEVADVRPEALGLPAGTQRRRVAGTTHQERLLDYLRRYGAITQREAVYHLGDWRLASTAHKLRRRGFNVHADTVRMPTRYGQTVGVARYHLIEGGSH